jgi:coenzyme PQQ precursor peptide PqqA
VETVTEIATAGKRNRRGAAVPETDPRRAPPTTKELLAVLALRRQFRDAQGDDPASGPLFFGSPTMRWSKPKIVEVAVGLEINSYACAKLV